MWRWRELGKKGDAKCESSAVCLSTVWLPWAPHGMTVLVSFQPSASAVPRMSSTAWAWLPGGIAPTQTVFLLLTTQLAGKGQP